MLKKTIPYIDFDGNKRIEDYYFNLTESELIDWQNTTEGGMLAMLDRIVKANDKHVIMKTFKDIILKSYGIKSDDGRRFMKSQEIAEAFSQSAAFNVLYQELLSDSKVAAEFVNAILPPDLAKKLADQEKEKEKEKENGKLLTPGI